MSEHMVQIRNVPASVHRQLKARAALEGLSMSYFVLREIRKALEKPTRREVLQRLRDKPVRQLAHSAAELIRSERDAR